MWNSREIWQEIDVHHDDDDEKVQLKALVADKTNGVKDEQVISVCIQIPRQSPMYTNTKTITQVSTTPYSDFNVCTPPCHGVAMMAESNLKYPEVFRIHGSTIISMVVH